MDIGMLWFDNDGAKPLTMKVDRAAEFYTHKYGRKPSLCFVHPTMFPIETAGDDPLMAGNVEIRTAGWVLPNHYFIGEEGAEWI